MQYFAAAFVILFSFLSLEVVGKPHRTIRYRPGSHHHGSGLGGGVFPFPQQTVTATRSASMSSLPLSATSSLVPTPLQTSLSSAYLPLHNAFRKQYAASPLAWSSSLASAAQSWASNCQWGHSKMSYGENIAAGTGGNFTAQGAFNMWASEAPQYNTIDPVPSHFTQVVWKGTTHVGCAVADCPGPWSTRWFK